MARFAAVPCLLAAAAGLVGGATGPLVVQTKYGTVQGTTSGLGVEHGVRAWLGVPFAAPPTGSLRWSPPEAPQSWDGTLDATAYKQYCWQRPSDYAPVSDMSEDCLYLNVWAPTEASEEPLPVAVWIHGGAYIAGGAVIPLYSGSNFVNSHEMIVVTIAYRLGVFGFGASDSLRERAPNGSTGMYGILDQRFALQWVQDNIAAFGGDPSRVMIFGESAGGESVVTHLALEGSKGLFHAAVAESGPYASFNTMTLEAGEASLGRVAVYAGCSDTQGAPNATAVQCMANMAAEELNDAQVEFFDSAVSDLNDFAPVLDGVEWSEPPQTTAYKQGIPNPVPLLIGSNRNEMALFLGAYPQNITTEQLEYFIDLHYPGEAGEVLELYGPVNTTNTPWDVLAASATDVGFRCTSHLTAQWLGSTASNSSDLVPVWGYHFTAYEPQHAFPPLAECPEGNVCHTAELPYVFGTFSSVFVDPTAEQQALSAQMQTYWYNMAAYASPNSPSDAPTGNLRGGSPGVAGTQPQWNLYNSSSVVDLDGAMMVLDLESGGGVRMTDGLEVPQCDFWRDYITSHLPRCVGCPGGA